MTQAPFQDILSQRLVQKSQVRSAPRPKNDLYPDAEADNRRDSGDNFPYAVFNGPFHRSQYIFNTHVDGTQHSL
jgi:hypothetical protein